MKSFKVFPIIEALTHLGGPQFNGEHMNRCSVSNVEEVTFIAHGYLRRINFYPLDVGNIIAKYLIHHRLTINFKQSAQFLDTKIKGVNYDEGSQRCNVYN